MTLFYSFKFQVIYLFLEIYICKYLISKIFTRVCLSMVMKIYRNQNYTPGKRSQSFNSYLLILVERLLDQICVYPKQKTKKLVLQQNYPKQFTKSH